MYLSLTSWSFPQLTLRETADLSKALGIGALDVSTNYRPGLNRAEILSDPKAVAEQVVALGVKVPNYYHHIGTGLIENNLALAGSIDTNARAIEQALTFADAADIPTVFFLPGIINPGQSRRQALEASAESIKVFLEIQKDFKAELCVEPIVRSYAESPEIVLELIDMTGIRLALDYSHFICLGYTQDAIAPLIKHSAHVHLRQARMGDLQAKFAKGTINFPALFADLRDAGYSGALAIESVHQDFMNAFYDDVITETVAMRDCYYDWAGIPARV